MATKTLQDLIDNGPNLRQAIAGKLGCDLANVPEANVNDLAKTLGLAPAAVVVSYTTKAGKTGAYLSCDDVAPAGRFGGGGKLFNRLGDPGTELTPETIDKMRAFADAFADRAQAIHDVCDAATDPDDS